MLMTLISTLHNLSRSVGVALLAATSPVTASYLIGGEMILYLLFKMVRGDFYNWDRLDDALAFSLSLVERLVVKVIVDFSGYLHMRHPNEMGGFAFSISMIWAQVFPFVALFIFDGEKEVITIFLVGSFVSWLVLNIAFFFTIDLKYVASEATLSKKSKFHEERI